MRVLGLADIHGDDLNVKKMADKIAEADLTILIGDLTNFGREKQALQILNLIEEKNSEILAVPGNCDFLEVEKLLKRKGFNIHGENRLFKGVCFAGLGYSLPTPYGATPNEFSENDLEAVLSKAFSDPPERAPLVLVSHQPPFQTMADSVREGEHVGSKKVRKFLEDYQPLICFTGHIHEGVGIDRVGKTQIVNPGPLSRGKYVCADFDADGIQKLEIRDV